MSKIVLDLDSPAEVVRLLRSYNDGDPDTRKGRTPCAVADAIEAAQGKRYIVLDVDDLRPEALALPEVLEGCGFPETAALVRKVRDQLDSLTPPRPARYYIAPDADDEPTLWREAGTYHDAPVTNAVPYPVARRCDNSELWDLTIADKFEVLSPGFDGARIGLVLEA